MPASCSACLTRTGAFSGSRARRRFSPPRMAPVIGVCSAARRLERQEPIFLVDVREPHEWEICRLEGARLAPLGELGRFLDSFPHDREIVVYCKGGVRSAKAARALQEAGFANVTNLTGGIN